MALALHLWWAPHWAWKLVFFFLPENLALSFAIFSGSVGLSSETPQQSLSLGKSSPRERAMKDSVCLWFFLAAMCRWRCRNGQNPWFKRKLIVQLSNFPQALVLVMTCTSRRLPPGLHWERRMGVTYLNNEVSVLFAESGKVGGKRGDAHFFWEHSLSLWLHFPLVASLDRTVLELKVMAKALWIKEHSTEGNQQLSLWFSQKTASGAFA